MSKRISKQAAKQLVARHNRRVARANKEFSSLTPSQKRVAIARDVLEQIRVKRLIPTNGVWLDSKGLRGLFTKADIKKNPERQVQEILATKKECTGCALGGMFMCAVERADALKLNELEGAKNFQRDMETYGPNCALDWNAIDTGDAFGYLRKFFSEEQLDLIESCFERNEGNSYSDEADEFARDEENPSERMRLIMENIIVNKGTFKPEKKPQVTYVTPGFEG